MSIDRMWLTDISCRMKNNKTNKNSWETTTMADFYSCYSCKLFPLHAPSHGETINAIWCTNFCLSKHQWYDLSVFISKLLIWNVKFFGQPFYFKRAMLLFFIQSILCGLMCICMLISLLVIESNTTRSFKV